MFFYALSMLFVSVPPLEWDLHEGRGLVHCHVPSPEHRGLQVTSEELNEHLQNE